MLARSCLRCVARARPAWPRPTISPNRIQCRRYSGSATASSPGSSHAAGTLAPIVTELDRLAPSFDINGDRIHVIKTPSDFYNTLKVGGIRGVVMRRDGLISLHPLGSHSKGKEKNLPVHSLHWTIRARIHQHCARCSEKQPRPKAQYLD
jgi:hypothetical protein